MTQMLRSRRSYPEGEGAYHSIKMSLDAAGLPAEKVGYINATRPSTPSATSLRSKAILRALGPQSKKHPCRINQEHDRISSERPQALKASSALLQSATAIVPTDDSISTNWIRRQASHHQHIGRQKKISIVALSIPLVFRGLLNSLLKKI